MFLPLLVSFQEISPPPLLSKPTLCGVSFTIPIASLLIVLVLRVASRSSVLHDALLRQLFNMYIRERQRYLTFRVTFCEPVRNRVSIMR